ncbi:hypothetical protein ACEWY4_002304 [Coilia grayii]|uniref:Separase n=1 Tax=Coilia grayii TaxID=363190 RepID=A0ABD1KMZ2_9TELE
MKCVKTEDFVRRIATSVDATALRDELEGALSGGSVPRMRVVCDRILHACYQRVGEELEAGLVPVLLRLVQLAVGGFEQVGEGRTGEPLYLEKMMFHILQRLLKAKQQWGQLALELFYRLKTAQPQGEEYQAMVQSCFVLLWKAAGDVVGSPDPTHTHTLRVRLEALRFRLLQESVCARGGTCASKACVYVEESLSQYRRSCGGLTHTQASAALGLLQECVTGPLWADECVCDLAALCVLTIKVCKMLSGAEHWDLANQHLAEAKRRVQGQGEVLCSALQLCDWSLQLHRLLRSSDSSDGSHIYSACARLLSNLPVSMETPSHPVLEACQLVVTATEEGHSNGLQAATLLAYMDFLKEYRLSLSKICEPATLQQTLCLILSQAFSSTNASLKKSQVLEGECLQQVVGQLQGSVAELMQQVQKLTNHSLLLHSVSMMNGVISELLNRKLYQEALSLVKPLCEQLVKSRPPSLPIDRVNHCFLQEAHSFRRVGDHQGALQAVSDWLSCLSEEELQDVCSITHSHTHPVTHPITHPITLWAKIKGDAAKTGDEEVRLRTLRDTFAGAAPSEALLIQVMEAELGAYVALPQDLYQEKYNTLCDLLDLCAEDGKHTHTRAHTLLQLAQVTCFHDLSQLTDCSPVDFAHEALRLLEAEPVSAANCDWLKDDTAHASLWLYICQLETSLQEAMATERRLREEQDRGGGISMEPLPLNDLDQEDREKVKESVLVYESLNFNLSQHTNRLAALNRSLSLWVELITEGAVPRVRHPAHTTASLFLLASLYTLMSKPLEALQSYQLAQRLSRSLGDAHSCASALCHSARLLLELGECERARVLLEQAEECVSGAAPSSSITVISMTTKLLRATLDYSTGEVARGVCGLCEVLCEVEKRHTVSFYMLKAQTLQTASQILSLDTHSLPADLRSRITQHGLLSPDVAQYEGMKILHSLVVMLLGDGLYGASSLNPGNSSTAQDNTGDGLLLKYQLLSEVCVCSRRLVCVHSRAGAAHQAKVQCVEALKLASKLQSINHCAELLVCKAEVEFLKGATEESALDLQRVKNLLESCTDSSGQPHCDVKLHPRKGILPTGHQAPPTEPQGEEPNSNMEVFLSSCPIPRILVEGVGVGSVQGSSPPLKQQSDWLKSLSHGEECVCLVCSDVTLGRVCVSWALVSAALSSHTQGKSKPAVRAHTHTRAASRLYHLSLRRCQHLSHTLLRGLSSLGAPSTHTHARAHTHTHPHVRVAVARALLGQAEGMMGRDPQASPQLWELLEKGLKVATPRGHMWAELLALKAELLALRGVACCLAIVAKQGVSLEELFSGAWGWNPPKTKPRARMAPRGKEVAQRAAPKTPASKTKSTPSVTLSSTPKPLSAASKALSSASNPPLGFSAFKTPRAPRSRPPPPDSALSVFDFSVDSPDRSHTRPRRNTRPLPERSVPVTTGLKPAHKDSGRGFQASGRGFQIYEDTSPTEAPAPKAPPAPRRTKRCRFKMIFSDESSSDSEAPPVAEVKKRSTQVSRKARAAQKAPPTQKSSRGKSQSDELIAEGGVTQAEPRPRRGRPKKSSACEEDVEVLCAVIDEEDLKGDHSFELLHLSDNDAGDGVDAPDGCEILRRDLGAETGRGHMTDIRKAVGQTVLAHTLSGGDVSLDSALDTLRSSWLLLQHFPPPALFSRLSALLAQSHGHKDPVTTAMLHAEALGISTRHQMNRYLASRMRKRRKGCPDVEEALSALRLSDTHAHQEEERQLQQLFAFPNTPPQGFPHTHTQRFSQQLQELPAGVTVCLMSVAEACPGMIDTLLLTRLEKGSTPITMRIPTAHRQHSLSVCVSELEAVLEEQKQLYGVTEKRQWWEGRRSLDSRMQRLLEHMQECLGLWRCLLLPLTDDPALSEELKTLTPLFSSSTITPPMLQVVLSAAPLLSCLDLYSLVEGAGLEQGASVLLQRAAAKLDKRAEPVGHTVLILDKVTMATPL